MPKARYCNKCDNTHHPPTGKKCNKAMASSDPLQQILTSVQKIQEDMTDMKARVQLIEDNMAEPGDNDASQPEEASAKRDTEDEESTSEEDSAKMPKLSNLKSDSDLQEKVLDRIKQLSQLSILTGDSSDSDTEKPRRKGKKSGRARTVADIVKKDIDWPHFHVYRGPERQPAKFEDLTTAEFVYGYLCITNATKNKATKSAMLCHLQELMEDATQYPWDSVRNYHSIVLHHLEMKRLTWQDDEAIQKLRRTYSMRQPTDKSANATASGFQPRGSTKGPVFCLTYQNKKCNETGDHSTNRGPVKHVCAYCLKQVAQEFRHPEDDCRRKKRAACSDDGAKNE